jgi:hypothetical protein
MENSRTAPLVKLILLGILSLTGISALEVGTNCIAVTCEVMEGKCCDRSDLELKITLADNCGIRSIITINRF